MHIYACIYACVYRGVVASLDSLSATPMNQWRNRVFIYFLFFYYLFLGGGGGQRGGRPSSGGPRGRHRNDGCIIKSQMGGGAMGGPMV